MPETITQAEAPIIPKGLCNSTVQERRSLMGTVSAAGWPFSEGTGWRHPHLRCWWQYSSVTESRLPAIIGGVWGWGWSKEEKQAWHRTCKEHCPIHKVTRPQSSWGCTVILSYRETQLWRKDGVPRKTSNTAEVGTPSMSLMGREREKRGAGSPRTQLWQH